jgi:putative ABC transport system permease protein
MFRNYLKTTWRNLWKHRTFAAINIFGLTIGLTCCLLIALYVRHELSYDNFQAKGNRIARVIMEYSFAEGSAPAKGNYTSVRVAPVLKRNFQEVENGIRMKMLERIVRYDDKIAREKNFMYADSTFFDIFSFKLLQGNASAALAAPHQVVLTRSTARKYFGNAEAVGKSINITNDSIPYIVTGIMEDCPSNSQIKFDFLASFSSLSMPPGAEERYWNANYTTYLLLRNEPSIAQLEAKLPAFMKKEMADQKATVNFYLEPFNSIHLHSLYEGFEPNNSITYIYILSAVAVLILVIACSTYINLNTARSVERAKEVGVRKVIGAGKNQLFWQFIGESFILCLMAVVLSLIIAAFLLPSFNRLSDKQLSPATIFSLPFILFSLAVAVAVSALAGSYPAVMLSKFKPIKVLKGSFKNSASGQWLRKSLIVFQFAISVFLIVSTFIVQKQLDFIRNKKLGYDREHVLVLPIDDRMMPKIELIKQQFKSNPDVVSVSRCVRSPVEGGGGYNMRSATMPEDRQVGVAANPVDEDFLQTTGLQLIAGSNFTSQDIKDVSESTEEEKIFHFILNESAAKQLGWTPQEAVGKKMFLDNSRPGYVSGVVKDFHFESLHNPVKPFVLFPEPRGRSLLVKLSGQHLPQTISFLETKWKAVVPDRPFEFHFMDDDYNKLYNGEMRLGTIMDIFAGLAIALACMGLFGLSSYSVHQRLKEIGIRKVLGASSGKIVMTLSKDFILLTFIAIMIAFPVAWLLTSNWLQDFTYRTSIGGGVYFITAALAICLTLITVSFQSIKAALMNPVKNLRTE